MRKRKERLTVTIDHGLIEVGKAAVAAGQAESLSAWVNLALAERVAKEVRLAALAEAIADYEAEFGAISEREIAEQSRADRTLATVVRGRPKARRFQQRGA